MTGVQAPFPDVDSGRQPLGSRGYVAEGKGEGAFSAPVDFCQISVKVCEEIIVLYFLIFRSLVVSI